MNHSLKHLIPLVSTMRKATHRHYSEAGLTHVPVPQIVGITGACENVDTLFNVASRVPVPLFFCQTGQLNLEQALQYYPGVYTIMVSGRDEEKEDARHVRQFSLTEEEFDWSLVSDAKYDEERMFEEMLRRIEVAVKSICQTVVAAHPETLIREFKQDAGGLATSLNEPFHRISYDEAVEVLKKNGFPELKWGDDLEARHETRIVELLNGGDFPVPVFIMRYPKDIKFFNMKVSTTDDRVVLSADLILPHSGEAVGSAVREHDAAKLERRLLGSTMFRLHTARGGTLDDFRWYLDIIGSGRTKPHAGYGIGNERVIQYLTGAKDIRDCSIFAQMTRETCDWRAKEKVAV
ncbi:MAG: amino acid--tRNA ligase-related protein [Patescibacteria group bacterium]|nr:amino acid--tRNA ligase-related protein [Patescibacteria group bacterium]